MIVLEKDTDIFQYVSERNRARQYDFLRTAFEVSKAIPEFAVGKEFLCDLNFYAVQYLSPQPGRYRHDGYNVTVGKHVPPTFDRVDGLMQRFWEQLGRLWERMSALESAAFALWSVNHIHPFAEGNGRSSRALTYFVLCTKLGYWLPGNLTITEQIRTTERKRYCDILNRMDHAMDREGMTDLAEMVVLLDELLVKQLQSAP